MLLMKKYELHYKVNQESTPKLGAHNGICEEKQSKQD
jgi:hypothetical protein